MSGYPSGYAGPAGTGGGGLGGISAGTESASSGTIVFGNSNGISFGMSDSTITASYTVPGTAGLLSNINVSAGTTSNNLSALTFSNLNGISFGLDAGTLTATVKTDYLTTAMASNRGSDFVNTTAALNLTSISATFGSNAISLSVGPYLTTAMASNRGSDFVQANAAFAGTSASGTIASSGISVSIGPYITTAMASNRASDFVAATAAFAGTNASGTINSTGISVSVAAPGGGDAIRGIAAGGSTASTNTVNFSNLNGVSFGFGAAGNSTVLTASVNSTSAAGLNTAQTNVTWTVNSSGISLNAAGYAGTTTGFSGTNVSATMTLNTLGLALQLSAPAPGGAGAAKSYFQWPEEAANSSAVQISGSSKYLQPIRIPYDLSVSYLRLPVTFSCVGSNAATATAANQTVGMTLSSGFQLAFYSLGTGASSKSLQSYYTTSHTWQQRATIQAAGVGSNWSSGHTISYPMSSSASAAFTVSAAATSASRTMNSSHLSNFTNLRFLDLLMETSFSGGAYWMAFNSTSSLATAISNWLSTQRILASNVAVSQPAQSINLMGVATNSSVLFQEGLGDWSTNSIGTTTGSIQLAALSRRASNPILGFQMIRQA